jgi:hypothetical protein
MTASAPARAHAVLQAHGTLVLLAACQGSSSVDALASRVG